MLFGIVIFLYNRQISLWIGIIRDLPASVLTPVIKYWSSRCIFLFSKIKNSSARIPVYKRTVVYATNEKNEVTDITGIVLTKMDGTAKGGIAVAIQSELGIPVKYIGVGETIDDLQKFDADDFVNALFERPKDDETSEEVSENK